MNYLSLFFKGFLLNLQFFTAVPIKKVLPMDKEHLRSSIASFPLVGLLQGILYSILLYLLMSFTSLSHVAIAFILWLFMIVLTGGIHLDGWMDCSDAYFSFQSKEKRLEVMSDPRVGAFGVLSVILLLSTRFLFIYELTQVMNSIIYGLIALIPFLSKGLMGVTLVSVKNAKNSGLATLFQQAGSKSSLVSYLIYILIISSAFVLQWNNLLFPFLLLLLSTFVFYWIVRIKAVKWFGGITGDVIGASVEGTELLLWMILWLLHYFAMV